MRTLALVLTLVACGGSPSSQPGEDAGGEDAGMTGDGGGDAAIDSPSIDPPPTCGTETCRVGETCDSGTCKAGPCTGATVPGDYASIQVAATALAAAGNDATICLANQVYPAPTNGDAIFLDDAGNHGKTLRIVGQGRDRSRLAGRFYVGGGWAKVTFEGVEITATTSSAIRTTEYMNPDIEVIASRLRGATGIEAGQQVNLRVDATELLVNGYGLSLLHNTPTVGAMTVRVENSVFSADGYGIRADSDVEAAKMSLVVVGSTFQGLDVGLDLDAFELGGGMTATISNSIFTGITGHAIAWSARVATTRTNNALWGNVTNYSDIASDGAGYVKMDCLLSPASPAPGLGAGSPCRGAGDPAYATTHDFYGVTRGSPPDIGAVAAP